MDTTSVLTWVEIDLNVLKKNIDILRSLISANTKMIGVVKFNAYGHGSIKIARVLIEKGVHMLGVADVEEGIELRNAGIHTPILIMNQSFPGHAEKIVQYNLIPMVSRMDFAQALQNCSRKVHKNQKVHIRIDTSDCSIGVKPEHFPSLIKSINTMTNLSVSGVFTHFISSYLSNEKEMKTETEKFRSILSAVAEEVHQPLNIHALSSPGLFRFNKPHFTSVRIGTSLYGLPSFSEQNMQGLQPVMQLKTRIIELTNKNSQRHLGYEGVTQLNNKPRIAVIPVGYGSVPSLIHMREGAVLIHGKRVPVVGNVFMGHMLADVTGLPNVQVGDEAVLFGRQGMQCIPAQEVALKCGVGVERCESICILDSRVKRNYIE